jgi:hypothetical protein
VSAEIAFGEIPRADEQEREGARERTVEPPRDDAVRWLGCGAADQHALGTAQVAGGVDVDPERPTQVDRPDRAALAQVAPLDVVPAGRSVLERALRGGQDDRPAGEQPGVDGLVPIQRA